MGQHRQTPTRRSNGILTGRKARCRAIQRNVLDKNEKKVLPLRFVSGGDRVNAVTMPPAFETLVCYF